MESQQGRDRQCLTFSPFPPTEAQVATDIVRFDEHENNEYTFCAIEGCYPDRFPATSSNRVDGDAFPFPPAPWISNDAGGWMYFNLNSWTSPHFSAGRASQGWVVVRSHLGLAGDLVTLSDAAWLANGCTPPVPSGAQIGRALNPTP
jgi:hypothetical protein